ncbi:MAG: hypothetical protein QOI25_1137, partial [Mycobacterium sp.]|nr:hypothetical protein [Mycobacterium sp.]
IRDCAEMAARSSLTRTESRWGLYHDRSDLPERDDENWRFHLNLFKDAEGSMEFLKRPVAPYFVPVPGLDGIPTGDMATIPVQQPPLVGGQAPATEGSQVRDTPPAQPPSPRIAAVLALESPTVDELSAFLSDPDAGVRRTAVDVLTEHLPEEYGPALLAGFADDDAGVRATTADGVRELVEVLPEPAAAQAFLQSADPVVRAAVVYLLSSRRVGEASDFRRMLDDPDHRVRIEAVRALVSVDDADGVSAASRDDNREVRITVANALGTLGEGATTVGTLIRDPDPLVRAAALAALGAGGFSEPDLAAIEGGLAESAWQVRQGAVRALAGVGKSAAVAPLTRALSDPHLDVRKAAVLSLTRWAPFDGAARDALNSALDDGDADVRAYARQALATASVEEVC